MAKAAIILLASWYSMASLVSEGTYARTRGVMSNGKRYREEALTCASNDYPLGTRLYIRNRETGKGVNVTVTDRMAKAFRGKRIDLSKGAFRRIADCKQGVVQVEVREVSHATMRPLRTRKQR